MSAVRKNPSERTARWYFGGLASAGAACCTHPLDLLKVNLQTHNQKNMSLIRLTLRIVQNQGILSLYNGISASLLRQLTYSTARFGIYEVGKGTINTDSFLGKVALAGISGTIGGFVGVPADMINVRMQNDVKLQPEQRRNYKHAVDGLIRVYKEEGFRRLFSGATTATSRGLFMTVGQIAFYEQFKLLLLQTRYFKDDVRTHVTASLAAGAVATTLTQPLDVLKTRAMNSQPGQYSGFLHLVTDTGRLGPLAFFKGYIPAFVRLGPQTILTFVFLEQLRINCGFVTERKKADAQ